MAWASVVAAPWLWSMGSVVVEHGLSCSVACGNFQDTGWNPCLFHCGWILLPLRHQGSPGFLIFKVGIITILHRGVVRIK